ncbi:MAG: sodium:solute symporter family protein [Methylophilales bacterium]|jgi:solute:Na+ symporter, SSS family|nr:sodium:solute symporter family protein [Pseudomonadota bacterium]NQW35355.1 sodium:solute symporter family protein [Methylophilales bacterium]|tara:strand:+ start:6726 stop:8150 length:1425 start_codon:yes stop_codon:yes gene_type:complete
MLIIFVTLYIFLSVAIGLFVSRKVKTSRDFAMANRSLPLPIVIASVFATWFGAEAVFGISATFVDEGLNGVVADPFGASLCLIIAGIIFSKYLYKLNMITLGDFYRKRYNKTIEIITTVIIMISYLGWVAAQITAIGLILSALTNGQISESLGMILGTLIIISYTSIGGMLSIAILDFVQMLVIIIGLIIISYYVVGLTGGITPVINAANNAGKLDFFPKGDIFLWLSFLASFITMMLGSITQQDVYQRITSAKSAKIALWGSIFGGLIYFIFAFIPMFIAYSAILIHPDFTVNISEINTQSMLPTFIIQYTPLFAQILFFGAVLSAIMSTSSATILAPSVLFVENILKGFIPQMTDKKTLLFMRLTLVVFSFIVLIYALNSELSIFGMVESAYKVTLVGAFTPLIFGIFWKKSNDMGAFMSIIGGVGSWLVIELLYGDEFIIPSQLVGLAISISGMLIGSIFFKTNLKNKLII